MTNEKQAFYFCKIFNNVFQKRFDPNQGILLVAGKNCYDSYQSKNNNKSLTSPLLFTVFYKQLLLEKDPTLIYAI